MKTVILRLDAEEEKQLNKVKKKLCTKTSTKAIVKCLYDADRYKQLYESTLTHLQNTESKFNQLQSNIKVFTSALEQLNESVKPTGKGRTKGLQLSIE